MKVFAQSVVLVLQINYRVELAFHAWTTPNHDWTLFTKLFYGCEIVIPLQTVIFLSPHLIITHLIITGFQVRKNSDLEKRTMSCDGLFAKSSVTLGFTFIMQQTMTQNTVYLPRLTVRKSVMCKSAIPRISKQITYLPQKCWRDMIT